MSFKKILYWREIKLLYSLTTVHSRWLFKASLLQQMHLDLRWWEFKQVWNSSRLEVMGSIYNYQMARVIFSLLSFLVPPHPFDEMDLCKTNEFFRKWLTTPRFHDLLRLMAMVSCSEKIWRKLSEGCIGWSLVMSFQESFPCGDIQDTLIPLVMSWEENMWHVVY